jgi:hypothetical protein
MHWGYVIKKIPGMVKPQFTKLRPYWKNKIRGTQDAQNKVICKLIIIIIIIFKKKRICVSFYLTDVSIPG